MALSLMESQNSSKPPKFSHFIGENYELALTQSIQTLLDSHNKPTSDFSAFTSNFSELMQTRANPPLESIWVYSALTFRSNNSLENRLSVTKDLFQSISACSASCSSSKSVALLAPVVYELYRLIVDLRGKDLGFKREKKVNREIKSLVDIILGYISVCCCKDWDDEDGLIQSLEDLVRVWIGENGSFKLFFPLVSDEIIERISHGGYEISELAGVVIAETFLLRLCLDSRAGIAGAELQKELRTWAIGSITGFRNICLFEILVGMLLEPTLPVASLLNSEDESFLRRVLYDTVILVDYSFVYPERLVDLPAQRIKSLIISRLMVTHEATELFRKGGDQKKAISYINAFSSSHLPSQIVKWVSSEIGTEHKASTPNGSSPKAFLRWLINLQNQGLKLLGDGISKFLSKLVLEISKVDYEELASKAEENKSNPDLLFYIDNKGEEENENKDDEKMNESMNAVFVAAAQTMKSRKAGGERKRKEGGRIGKEKRVKFLKPNLYDNSGSSGEFGLLRKDGSSSESEVENPLFDEESE